MNTKNSLETQYPPFCQLRQLGKSYDYGGGTLEDAPYDPRQTKRVGQLHTTSRYNMSLLGYKEGD